MEYFPYRDGKLYAENVAVSEIASAHGTPCYMYSRAALEAAEPAHAAGAHFWRPPKARRRRPGPSAP